MYNSIMATHEHPLSPLPTVAIVIFGNYIIMNLFISVLLQGFADDGIDEEGDDPQHETRGTRALLMDGIRRMLGRPTRNTNRLFPAPEEVDSEEDDQQPKQPASTPIQFNMTSAMDEIVGVQEGLEDTKMLEIQAFQETVVLPNHNAFGVFPPRNPVRLFCAYVAHQKWFDNFILVCILVSSLTLILEGPDYVIVADHCPTAPEVLDCRGLSPGHTVINCPRNAQEEDFGKLFGACGSNDAPDCCHKVSLMAALKGMDIAFTVIFSIEMSVKLLAEGVLWHDKAYFRDAWNLLDCFIVIVSIITILPGGSSGALKSLKSLRAVRALRPLRVIKRNPNLKITVVCLLASIPSMFNVGVVVFVWFSVYAMLGVQFFKGKLYRCYDLNNQEFYGTAYFPLGNLYSPHPPLSNPGAIPTIIECASQTNGLGTWYDKDASFNTYPRAFLTLVEMATTEGWLDVMAATVDSINPGITPIPNENPGFALYSVFHIFLGAFVLLNLIVGSIINNYTRIKSLNNGIRPFMTPEQQEWKETQRLISQLRPKRRQVGPSHPLRNWCFRVSISTEFEMVITFVICLNILSMMTTTHDQSKCFETGIFWTNVAFTIIFVCEAIIKIAGLGPRWYFRDGWNRFDLAVVVLSLVTSGLDFARGTYSCAVTEESSIPEIPALQILRAFRIARVFRLVRRAKGLKNMIQTLIISLPALGNIGGLILLFTFIFAILGTTAFYNTNLSQDVYGRMDEAGSYKSFEKSVWLLFRQTTGEGWQGIMYYTSKSDWYWACEKTYEDYYSTGCGSPVVGVLFHVFWQFFGTYVMMQLFTAVILENFDDLAKEDKAFLPIEKLNEFVDIWTSLDPFAEEVIEATQLPGLIRELSPPLGVRAKGASTSELLKVIKDLQIPIREGEKVLYRDTFLACVKRVMTHAGAEEDELGEDGIEGVHHEDGRHSHSSSPDELYHAQHTVSDMVVTAANKRFRGRYATVAEDYAARLVQKAYREWRERRLQVNKSVCMTKRIPLEASGSPIVDW